MGRYRRFQSLPAAVALFLLAAAACPQAPARDDAFTEGVISRDTALRERPYSIGKRIGSLDRGTEVSIHTRRGYWLEVETEGSEHRGWVRLIRVRPRDSAAAPSRSQGTGGGFFASLSRGATGLLGGSRRSAPRETTTIGIRGLSAQDLTTASPDPAALKKLERFSANPQEAQRFAAAGQLQAHEIAEPAPKPAFSAEPDSSGEQDKSW